jgi:hypothetical protein
VKYRIEPFTETGYFCVYRNAWIPLKCGYVIERKGWIFWDRLEPGRYYQHAADAKARIEELRQVEKLNAN